MDHRFGTIFRQTWVSCAQCETVSQLATGKTPTARAIQRGWRQHPDGWWCPPCHRKHVVDIYGVKPEDEPP